MTAPGVYSRAAKMQNKAVMELNWTGRTARYFIENGKLTSLLAVFLFLWGGMSFWAMPKKYNPTIVAPAFQVVIEFPGASREEVLEQVTKPLENVLTDIPGVEDVYSVTTRGGRAVVNVNFYVGEDLDAAKIALDDRIRSDMNLAPLGIPAPMISSIDPENVPIVTIAVESDELGPVPLRKFAFQLRDRLSTVPGTSRIFVTGGRRRELSILVDQKKLSHFGLSLGHVEQALAANNLFLPAGVLKGEKRYTPLETLGWVASPEEAADIVVLTSDAVDVRLKDVARVRESPEEAEDFVRHVKKGGAAKAHAVLLTVAKLKGENIATVSGAISSKLERLVADGSIPSTVRTEIIVNDGVTAKEEIDRLLGNLATAIVIVTAVLFAFLNFKAAVLVAIAIPMTLASVFGIAFLAGQDVNRITLFALILSLGLLVDNATVVIENIVRNAAKRGARASSVFFESVNEVGPGLFMSTVTTVLAFLPMAFISGMMGPYMGPIPFFVPAALIFSLIISLSINPWMASRIIGDRARSEPAGSKTGFAARIMDGYRSRLRRIVESPVLRRRTLGLIACALALSALLPAVKLVKFRMLPKANVDQFFIYLDMPDGTSLEETRRVSRDLETLLLEKAEVSMVQSFVGRPPIMDFNGLFKGVSGRTGFHQASLRVGLVGDRERERTSEELVLAWRGEITETAESSGGNRARVKLIEDPPGPPVLSTVLVRIQGWDQALVENEARALFPRARGVEGVVDADLTLPDKTETLQVVVDHAATSKAKVSPAQIVETLNALYSGKVLGIYHNRENIEQELVRMRFSRDARISPKTLESIMIRNQRRISVPLSRLVRFERVPTQPPLRRENHVNTVYVDGEMGNRSVAYAGIDLLNFLFSYKLADGEGTRTGFSLFGADYKTSDGKDLRISLGGEWELTVEVFRDLMLAMLVALIVIYFALVAQFNSYLEPLIVFSTIPLSVIGVFPGFMLLNFTRGEYFTATSMIGTIALAGIAVNNAIILLEYLNSLKGSGMGLADALVDASATRLRPIALTTITTMLGSMTIIGDPVWAGLAWAIILGLGVSSSLVLVLFPVLYAVLRGNDWKAGKA
jgi:multidrug efflux pump subunit AcrB